MKMHNTPRDLIVMDKTHSIEEFGDVLVEIIESCWPWIGLL